MFLVTGYRLHQIRAGAEACLTIDETVNFADALSPSLLKHLLKAERGVQQDDSLVNG